MIYNKWSLVGMMLWARYALARLRPLTSLASIYAEHLESPGTKAYTPAEARALFAPYATNLDIHAQLTHGDLLSSKAGQRPSRRRPGGWKGEPVSGVLEGASRVIIVHLRAAASGR